MREIKKTLSNSIFFGIGVILVVGALVIGVIWSTMLLWNMLIPELFNGPVLGFWQTLGLLILTRIFFSGTSIGKTKES